MHQIRYNSYSCCAMLLFVILLICSVVNAKPTGNEIGDFGSDYGTEIVPQCYDVVCPTGTAACSRSIKASRDRKTITTTVQCEDVNSGVLKSYQTQEENPQKSHLLQRYSFNRDFVYNRIGNPIRYDFGTYSNNNKM